jgi:hypothetical protein
MSTRVALGGTNYLTDVLPEPSFAPDGATWRAEGSGEVAFNDHELLIDTIPKRVHTVWLSRAFTGDVYVVFEVLVLPPRGESNVNVFLHARLTDGGDVLTANLSGDYEEYHRRCAMYIFTLTGYDPDGRRDAAGNLVTVGWSRVRKAPGFRLLSENRQMKSEVGVPYRVEIARRGARLIHAVNGTIVHDAVDSDPLPGGNLALRTFNTRLVCRALRVARIVDEIVDSTATQ